jgi:hypothetical protein
MYWVSNISAWNYIDISGRTHGRIDWFEDIRDMGYWWQTAHENGVCFSIEQARCSVEDALSRRYAALAARYDLGAAAGDESETRHARGDTTLLA